MSIPAIIDTLQLRCPHCGYVGPMGDFDVVGIGDGWVFCNECNTLVAEIWADETAKPGEQRRFEI
jgi:hypothetical protein